MSIYRGIPGFRQRLSSYFLAIVSTLVAGCHTPHESPKPILQITRVPNANAGGPEALDFIEGRVTGVGPGQQVVLYAHSGVWWIQPFKDREFTKIQPDSTWKNSTHLGTEYAALLVDPGYRPAAKIATLPSEGNGVAAIVIAKGKEVAPVVAKVIHFSGYDWTVRAAGSDRGGQPNAYDPDNAWVDQKGFLHLRIAEKDGKWSCAEVSMNRSLGYGLYRFVVHDRGHLGPSAVLGMFTWDEFGSDETRRELDIELSRWGNPNGKNAQYVVQPFYVPENVARFNVPSGVATHTLKWQPGSAAFKTIPGSIDSSGAKTISEHVFTSGVPTPAGETVHIDLYDFHLAKSTERQPAEVVIEKFEFLP